MGKSDIQCSLGCDEVEDQKHLFDCPELNDDEDNEALIYEDIYGNDIEKIKRVNKRLMKRLETFTTSVNRQTKPCSATAENNSNDGNSDNRSDVSVVDLDL